VRPSLLRLLAFCLVALWLAGCGSTASSSGNTESTRDGEALAAPSDEGGIEVTDLVGEDGADAIGTVESEGLTATLADANDDLGFDSSRDASGCEVTDQSPAAGEVVDEASEVEITVDCAQVARPRGFEPLTFGSVDRRSTCSSAPSLLGMGGHRANKG
jgi:hypothetical protein